MKPRIFDLEYHLARSKNTWTGTCPQLALSAEGQNHDRVLEDLKTEARKRLKKIWGESPHEAVQ